MELCIRKPPPEESGQLGIQYRRALLQCSSGGRRERGHRSSYSTEIVPDSGSGLSSTRLQAGLISPCLDHEWAPAQLVKRKPPQSSRVWLGTSRALRATAQRGVSCATPHPHPTCSQEITLPPSLVPLQAPAQTTPQTHSCPCSCWPSMSSCTQAGRALTDSAACALSGPHGCPALGEDRIARWTQTDSETHDQST